MAISEPLEQTNEEANNDSGSRSGWMKIIVIGLVVFAGLAGGAAFLKARTPKKIEPRMTHVVARGDLQVTVIEQGTLESSENTEIKCGVRGNNTVIFVVESGTIAKKGQVLLRLDTLFIEEQINERSKYAHWSRSGAEQSKADVNRSKLAVDEYKEGRFKAELMTLEKDLAIAETQLRTAKNMLDHAEMMLERGYVSDSEVEDRRFRVTQSQLAVDAKKTDIDVLERFTKKIQIETLKGNLNSNQARHAADKERAFADAARRDRALAEFKLCVVRAPRDGLVIHPSAARWRNAPQIEEGVNVWKEQVLLLMPNLDKMQVKIGIHESMIDRVEIGREAVVTLTDRKLKAKVSSVSEVARPAGWWTGNVVKYDTIIKLPKVGKLKPGQSAEVEVILASYKNKVLLPVAAVLETEDGDFCWVTSANGEPEKRTLKLGDTNDVHVIVESGIEEGEEVILNPLSYVEDAQDEVIRPQESKKKKKTRRKRRNRKGKAKKRKDQKKGKGKKGKVRKKKGARKDAKKQSKKSAVTKKAAVKESEKKPEKKITEKKKSEPAAKPPPPGKKAAKKAAKVKVEPKSKPSGKKKAQKS